MRPDNSILYIKIKSDRVCLILFYHIYPTIIKLIILGPTRFVGSDINYSAVKITSIK